VVGCVGPNQSLFAISFRHYLSGIPCTNISVRSQWIQPRSILNSTRSPVDVLRRLTTFLEFRRVFVGIATGLRNGSQCWKVEGLSFPTAPVSQNSDAISPRYGCMEFKNQASILIYRGPE